MTDQASNQSSDRPASDGPDQQSNDERDGRQVHTPEREIPSRPDPNRMFSRHSPVEKSDAALVSRDYQPRTGGPELVASWPLGPTPAQTGPGGDDWEVTDSDYVTLQKNFFTTPYVAPIECSILYLNFCGRAHTESDGDTLTLGLTTDHLKLSGEPYETAIDLSTVEGEYFLSPLIEFAPDVGDYEPGHDIVSGYELRAKVSGGTGYIDQGTAVQLWSE